MLREAVIIRQDERKANNPDTRNSLHHHRVTVVRREARASLLAESWGPVWRLAADAGLPTFGPLQLPGHWVIR